MRPELLTGGFPLVVLVLAAIVLLAWLAYPMFRKYPDDQGNGMALVLLPPPKLPALWRAPLMMVVFIALDLAYHSTHGPAAPDSLYASALTRILAPVLHAPTEISTYQLNFQLGLRFLVVGTMVSLAVTARGGIERRLLVALQAVWYLAAMLAVDALLIVAEVVLSIPSGPSTLIGSFAALAIGFVALARLLFGNFALPQPSAVPFAPRRMIGDAAVLITCTVAGMAVSAAVVLWLYSTADPRARTFLALVIPVPFAYSVVVLRTALLWLFGKVNPVTEPEVTDERPPIEVIIPAYQEEAVIVDTLVAIDRAAARYGGPVHVTMANDGSTDRTRELAAAAMAGFEAATGRIIDVRHGGKSATLNAALAETTSDIVVRIDADTLIGEWSLYWAHRWFRDPSIGLVEAMMFPRWVRSPFPRMRLFETLKQFGMVHRTIQAVDGVNVVPGVFTAFRREAAVALGGFTVGMNGEDGDLTLRFSRLGYKMRMDPKVVIGEDVPPTFMEIREQRVRWDRATIHNDARHGPYRAGIGTPKVWFTHLHQFFIRMFSPIRLTLPAYLVVLAIFEGTYRSPVLVFGLAWLLSTLGFMALEVLLAVSYRQERRLPWLLVWPFWQLCTIVFSVEAWLSLPARPVFWQPGAMVTKPVVH